MSTLPGLLALNASALNAAAPANPASAVQPSANSVGNFSETLAAAMNAQNDVGATSSVGEASDSAAAQERAREVLQLNGAPTAQLNGSGDAVLNGLQQLRGAFDKEISTFSISSAASGTTEGLYRAQVAAANFSIFMDVASKLAGKGDQAFNSLLKGQ